jgi:hypothetical protein
VKPSKQSTRRHRAREWLHREWRRDVPEYGPTVRSQNSIACRRISDMMARFVFVLFASTCLFAQCDDIEISTKEAKHSSEVMFQGTIEGFKGSGIDRTVIFRVSRVWKGRVGPTFEMPAIETDGGLCTAFWRGLLAVGNELVVYASRQFIPDRKEYLPLRSKTTLVSRAKDMSALGQGHKPK